MRSVRYQGREKKLYKMQKLLIIDIVKIGMS